MAYTLALRGRPHFHWGRYEDLVADPAAELLRLVQGLGLDISAPFATDLRDATGAPWLGNSSHGEQTGIDSSSIGIQRDFLDSSVAQVIEAACLPELQNLGYATSMTAAEAKLYIERFREPYAIARTGMENDIANEENARREIERLDRIMDPPGPNSASWFLFERAHRRLRGTFRAS